MLAVHVFVWMLCFDVLVMQRYKLSATEYPLAKKSGNGLWYITYPLLAMTVGLWFMTPHRLAKIVPDVLQEPADLHCLDYGFVSLF
jgi:hypothetical protein